jgi:hypothetical protein
MTKLLVIVPLAGLLLNAAPQTAIDSQIRFANDRLELRFSRTTGRWLAMYELPGGQKVMDSGEQLAPVVLTTDGQTTFNRSDRGVWSRAQLWSLLDTESIGPQLKLVAWREQKSGGMLWLTLDTAEGNWRIQQKYGMQPTGDTVTRRVRLTWNGEDETLLRWVDLRTPCHAASGILEAPGYPSVPHQPLEELPLGQWPAMEDNVYPHVPGNRPGILVFRQGDRNLVIWGFDKTIPSLMLINRGDRGIWATQRLFASCRMQKGQSLEVGTQYIRIRRGELRDSLKDFQQFWLDAGLRLIGKTPDWAKDARIYEVHLGRKTFPHGSDYEPYPVIQDLINDLPRIAGLGFSIIQLMPRFPFPGYAVHDYLDVETQYAPPAELRHMVDRAHNLGMKVILDVVMHGVTDHTLWDLSPFPRHPWLTQHPDWFLYGEDGRVAGVYTWGLDHASPSFQDYIVQVFSTYVRNLDVDGFRTDALDWNFIPNWAQGLPRPAYQSFYGSAPMFERVREHLLGIKPEVMFYTETGGPVYAGAFDACYNYDEQPFFAALLPVLSKRGFAGAFEPAPPRHIEAQYMAEWLEMRRWVLPQSMRKIHHSDSHDSYEWGGLGMFRKEAFGVGGARLLFAYSAFMDGGVMNYTGAEKGSEDYYRKVLSLRESIPAIREGSCDYLAVRPIDRRVFTPLRRLGDHWALPVLSFSAEPIKTEIPLDSLGLDPGSTYTLFEAFSGVKRAGKGKDLMRLPVELSPYGVQLWTPEPAGGPTKRAAAANH